MNVIRLGFEPSYLNRSNLIAYSPYDVNGVRFGKFQKACILVCAVHLLSARNSGSKLVNIFVFATLL